MNGNLQSFNPADRELVGEVETSSSEQIHRVVNMARAALPSWQQLDFTQRAEKMQQAADALLEESEQLGTLLHRKWASRSRVRLVRFAFVPEASAKKQPKFC